MNHPVPVQPYDSPVPRAVPRAVHEQGAPR
ncbi:hypothetical protein B046DRAFT_00154 [Streptomyces sp. LamerLS-316]|nr:hypothetical protein B046DRAFT_00154 [Streptomyces sp. LamerLS-316]